MIQRSQRLLLATGDGVGGRCYGEWLLVTVGARLRSWAAVEREGQIVHW